MPAEVDEKIKKAFRKCGQPIRWARTTARMNIEFCPFETELIAETFRFGSVYGTFSPTVNVARVYSNMMRRAIFLVASLMLSSLLRSRLSAAATDTASNPAMPKIHVVVAVHMLARWPGPPVNV
jgi:hypothetical protein